MSKATALLHILEELNVIQKKVGGNFKVYDLRYAKNEIGNWSYSLYFKGQFVSSGHSLKSEDEVMKSVKKDIEKDDEIENHRLDQNGYGGGGEY